MKNIVIACLMLLIVNVALAQINSNIYLKDGTNFIIKKAFDLGNDSISLLIEDNTCIRIAIVDLYKIILCENFAKIPDSVSTITLVTGVKYAAHYAFNFKNGTVNLKLKNGEIKNVPIEMIENFKPVDGSFFNTDQGKLNYSFGLNALFCSPYDKTAPALELSGLYKMNALLDVNLFAGIYIKKLNSGNYSELEHLDNFQVPKTEHQLKANRSLYKNDYERIERTGNLFKNMNYVGAKMYFYLFGYEIKNYVGVGLNYYFGQGTSTLLAETKWLEYDRTISYTDTVVNFNILDQEPVVARSIQNIIYTRKAFGVFNASYKIKYWIGDNCFLTNEIGVLLGRMKINIDYQQNNEYQYIFANYYQDETSSDLNYNYDTKVPFNQLYLSVGLYFNK